MIPDAALLVDLAGRCLDANEQALDLLGYERVSLLDVQMRDVLGFWPPEIIRTWQPVNVRRADGSPFQMLMSAAPLPGPAGSDTRYAVFFRLLQEQGGDEAATSQLAALVTASTFPIVGVSPRGEIISWNPAAERLFGHSTAEVIGEPAAILLPPETQALIPEIIDVVLRGTVIQDYETVAVAKDGRRIEVAFSAAPVTDARGNVVAIAAISRDLTAQRESEQTLHLWSRALNAAPSGIIIASLEDGPVRIVDVNPAFEAITGYRREEVLGRDFRFLEGPETNPEVLERYRAGLLTGQDVVQTYVNYRKDGTPYWAEVRMATIQDQSGVTTHIVGIHTDVTARRETEAALRLRDSALAAAPSGISIATVRDGAVHVVDVNPAFETITGYSREEILGRDFISLAGPATDPEAMERIGAKLLAGQDAHETVIGYRKDGAPYWAEVHLAPVRDAKGEMVAIVVIHTDVTARREAEQGLRLWEGARQAAPNSIVITDAALPRSHIIDVNPAFEAMTGYTREEVLGRDFGFLRGPETEGSALSRMVDDIAAGRDTSATLINYRKDGTPYWVEMHIAAVRDERGEIVNYVAIQADITDRKATEEALAREQDLLTALIRHLPDAVYVKDIHSRFLRLNQATADELGVADPAMAIGKSDRDFFPAELAEEYQADERLLLETGEPMMNKTERQIIAGEERWVLATKAPLRDSQGRVIGLVGSNRDITTMRELQEERDRLHRELQAEIRRTAEVQAQLLPHDAPDVPGYEFAGICLPSRVVGGDYYDWFTDRGRVRLALGDVMGKGVPASLLTATVRAALRSVSDLPLDTAVEAVNRALFRDLSQSDSFITLFTADLEPERGGITFVDAGHGLALVLRADGSVQPLRQHHVPLGVLDDASYPTSKARLNPGDTLLIYSDGLPDARPDLRLDPEGIAALIRGLTHVKAIMERLIAVATDVGDRPDDLTLVLVHRR